LEANNGQIVVFGFLTTLKYGSARGPQNYKEKAKARRGQLASVVKPQPKTTTEGTEKKTFSPLIFADKH